MAVLSLLDDGHRLRSERLAARPPSAAKGAVAWLGIQLAQVGVAVAGQVVCIPLVVCDLEIFCSLN